MKTTLTRDKIMTLLTSIQDPEIGLNIVDLGLIDRLEVTDAVIDLSLIFTAQACPLRQLIVRWVDDLLTSRSTQSVRIAVEETVSWTPERLTAHGREALGYPARTTSAESSYEPDHAIDRPV